MIINLPTPCLLATLAFFWGEESRSFHSTDCCLFSSMMWRTKLCSTVTCQSKKSGGSASKCCRSSKDNMSNAAFVILYQNIWHPLCWNLCHLQFMSQNCMNTPNRLPRWPSGKAVCLENGRPWVWFLLAPWGFFWVESYQWLKNWHSCSYPVRHLAL